MKWIFNKYIFLFLFGISTSFLTYLAINETIIRDIKTQNYEHRVTKDAIIVYSFVEGHEKILLEVSATLLGDAILAPHRYSDYDIEKLKFLCNKLNNNVKNIILENFDQLENKNEFNVAYDKFTKFCSEQ